MGTKPAVVRFLVAVPLIFCLAEFGRGQCLLTERDRMDPSDPSGTQLFGYSIAMDGARAVVGAWKKNVKGPYSGAAYVLRWTGEVWEHEQKLFPSDAAQEDEFGYSVDLDGDLVVVGARKDDDGGTDTGSAYVFRRVGGVWVEEQKLVAPVPVDRDEFGTAVAVEDDVVAVGAPFDDVNGDKSGAVYVYRHDGASWSQDPVLMGSDTVSGDQYGQSLSLDGGILAVAAALDNDDGFDSGVVFVFEDDGTSFQQLQKITASDAATGDQFGSDVDVEGARILVGARREDQKGQDSGAAYLFEFDGVSYLQVQKLVAQDLDGGEEFGHSVELGGNVIIVGAPEADENGAGAGAAYLFRRQSGDYREQVRLAASNPDPGDQFGYAVASNNGRVLVGAFGDEIGGNGPDAGALYTYLARPLDLLARPRQPAAGAALTIASRGGQPGSLEVLTVVDVNGVSTFVNIYIGVVSVDCRAALGITVPASLSGLSVQVMGFGTAASGVFAATNVETLVFP